MSLAAYASETKESNGLRIIIYENTLFSCFNPVTSRNDATTAQKTPNPHKIAPVKWQKSLMA